ncbi:YkoP family protein [Paenibacillus glacialis]|uniref:Polysaccharide deacetylase n=1 Tax=Paenibacillus glacialis TaxID=494026 RepID=A0A168MIP6_9BACL|nr:polysaccharide deacetylase [Paenibacillus glacialis]OAB44724.1 polysaccharide deacetylase [Paenibacillus glacialis]
MTILNIVSTVSRTGMQSAWMAWEGLFDQITKIRSVSVTQYGICKLVVRKHLGNSIACDNGYYIHAGDCVGELHLDNRKMLELSRTNGADRTALMTARMLRKSLEQISYAMEHNPELRDVKALTGITLLHRGIIHGLGFEQHPIQSKWIRVWMTFYLRFLLRVLHPVGRQRVKQSSSKLVPMMLMMSRQSLIHRFRKEVQS